MTNKSWLVTLTPLLIGIIQLIEAYAIDGSLSTEKLNIVIVSFMTFLGSGAIGVAAKRLK